MIENEDTYLFGERERYPHYLKHAALLGAVIMTGMTFFLAWWTLRPMAAAIASPHTETTEGIITKLAVRKLPRTTRLAPTQGVELEYVYSVKEQEFAATRYRPTDTGPISGFIILEILENCHLGDTVTVYYNPEDVSDAVLKPAHFDRSSIGPLIGVVIFTVVLWIIFILAP
jgi:hypothetical protein